MPSCRPWLISLRNIITWLTNNFVININYFVIRKGRMMPVLYTRNDISGRKASVSNGTRRQEHCLGLPDFSATDCCCIYESRRWRMAFWRVLEYLFRAGKGTVTLCCYNVVPALAALARHYINIWSTSLVSVPAVKLQALLVWCRLH